MLLRRLKEYADERLNLPPTLYSEMPVRYIIELKQSGELLSPQPTDTSDPSNARLKRGRRRAMPQITRTVGITPLLFADNAEYTLGLARETSKPERVELCHRSYLDIVGQCADQTNDPYVRAVQSFLANDPVGHLDLPTEFNRGDTITFRVDGIWPTERPAVQSFWAGKHDPAAKSERKMQCIVCGQERPVLDRLQGTIKGIPGGQTSGTSIISANALAFESYGLEASLIAPTCANCGERFTKALNHLIADEQSRFRIAGSIFVYWTREDVAFDLMSYMDDPQPSAVQALINTAYKGGNVVPIDDTAFYATVLSASGSRVVVRDWIDTTLSEVYRRLAQWFTRQRIVDDYRQEARPLGLYALAGATVRELRDLPPTTVQTLLHSLLTGSPLPMGLLYQAVRRNRAEQRVTRQRAALIKLVLRSQPASSQEDTMVQLDANSTNAAYRAGRLLAVLAEIQRLAIGKAAIVDRFFGTASSAPASVFGRLLRGAQPHMTKLERDNKGAAFRLQRSLEEIMSGIGRFPQTLSLEDQALFALGYYHQRAHDRAEMMAASERRKAKQATNAGPPIEDVSDDTPLQETPADDLQPSMT